ncbi:hypothetical protein ACIA5C_25365 [Actinoplanes sp. NPDC051343]
MPGGRPLALARRPPAPGESMQHGDLGPWNLLWGPTSAVTGVID